MLRRYPNIRGKIDSTVENEIKSVFDYLYDTIELLANRTETSLEIIQKGTPSMLQATPQQKIVQQSSSVGLESGVFAQSQIGQVADPNLRPNIPANYVFSDMNKIAGLVVVGGKIAIQDGLGHTFNFLVE
jgi:hypothetical protein